MQARHLFWPQCLYTVKKHNIFVHVCYMHNSAMVLYHFSMFFYHHTHSPNPSREREYKTFDLPSIPVYFTPGQTPHSLSLVFLCSLNCSITCCFLDKRQASDIRGNTLMDVRWSFKYVYILISKSPSSYFQYSIVFSLDLIS